jgi:hypothetical protein
LICRIFVYTDLQKRTKRMLTEVLQFGLPSVHTPASDSFALGCLRDYNYERA